MQTPTHAIDFGVGAVEGVVSLTWPKWTETPDTAAGMLHVVEYDANGRRAASYLCCRVPRGEFQAVCHAAATEVDAKAAVKAAVDQIRDHAFATDRLLQIPDNLYGS